MADGDYADEVFPTQRGRAPIVAVLVLAMLAMSLGIAFFATNVTTDARWFVGTLGVVLTVPIWANTLLRVRIGHSQIVCEYALRRRVVRYADITDLELETETSTYYITYEHDLIVIRRRHGMPVVLRGFDDEIAGPFGALQRRWSAWMDHVHPQWRTRPPWER
jgi:hypothetical protein